MIPRAKVLKAAEAWMRTCGMSRSHSKKAVGFHSVETLWRMMPIWERLKMRFRHRFVGRLQFPVEGGSIAMLSGALRRDSGRPITATLESARRESGAQDRGGTGGSPARSMTNSDLT